MLAGQGVDVRRSASTSAGGRTSSRRGTWRWMARPRRAGQGLDRHHARGIGPASMDKAAHAAS